MLSLASGLGHEDDFDQWDISRHISFLVFSRHIHIVEYILFLVDKRILSVMVRFVRKEAVSGFT